jgi:prepilin-type N-terminal cleavage/methylation domain-containing protein
MKRHAFTLTELLVVITIIGILAAMMLGAVNATREMGKEYATKATIAKLNDIIMERYESYMTRRVPISTQGMPPKQSAQNRLYAIRDLMRMEMPDRLQDVPTPPVTSPSYAGPVGDAPIMLPNPVAGVPQSIAIPALPMLYYRRLAKSPPSAGNGVQNGAAELLYMIVSMGDPEAMEQFNSSEIGDTNSNGYQEFLDGWGRPIFFLRWAPGFSSCSDIQPNDPLSNHDPFDSRKIDDTAWQLIPLIYSGGSNMDPGLEIQPDYWFSKDNQTSMMFSADATTKDTFLAIGRPAIGATSYGGITNHHIEQR